MSGFHGYDQWKTTSPYDDEPDWVEIGEKYLKRQTPPKNEKEAEHIDIIRGLLDYIDSEI